MSNLREAYRPTTIIKPVIDPYDHNYRQDELSSFNDAPIIWERKAEQKIEKERQSIFESYDPINDAERLQKLSHLSPELQKYYIKENLLSYFEEFAAEIKVKKLAGIVKDTGEIEMLGTNVTDMYNHSAYLAGPGSREDRERRGLNLITKGLCEGNNRVCWASPPKLADYGFVFTFVADEHNEKLGGRPFRELLLRYDEPLNSIDRSKSIYNAIRNNAGIAGVDSSSFKTADDFLDHPLMYSNNGFHDLNDLYHMLNISDQDAEKSELFRQRLQPYIEPMMEEYTNILRQMSLYDLNSKTEQLKILEDQCRVLIGGMFNTARIINRSFDREMKNADQKQRDEALLQQLEYGYDSPNILYQHAMNLARYEDLTIAGGSSCPVTRYTGNSELQFLSSMQGGMGWDGASQMTAISELFSKKEKWVFDKTGTCKGCHKSHESVGLLGPCYVCRTCQKEFDMKEQIEKMVRILSGKVDAATALGI